MTQGLDLNTIFKAVTGTLAQNKETLNEADAYNHDHGDNMVQIFDVVQKAVARRKSVTPSKQLAYASQQLRQKASSGSAQVYAEGLENASEQFTGKQLTPDTIGILIQSLMGMQQPAQQTNVASDGSLLSTLLTEMTGQTQVPTQTQGGGDLIGSLLSGLTGKQLGSERPQTDGNILGSLLSGLTSGNKQSSEQGLDASDLLSAGLAFYVAKQQGGSNIEAIMSALSKSSPLGQSSHRTQSGAMVINTILNLLGSKK